VKQGIRHQEKTEPVNNPPELRPRVKPSSGRRFLAQSLPSPALFGLPTADNEAYDKRVSKPCPPKVRRVEVLPQHGLRPAGNPTVLVLFRRLPWGWPCE
jgi:hypothetical protein